MNGDFVEGQKLTATYGYIGGYEGCSQYSWYLHEVGVLCYLLPRAHGDHLCLS